MFVIAQSPISDMRRFVVDDTYRLTSPCWPSPEPGREFVRRLGGVKPRTLGGVGPWAGEDVYCDARHALRFVDGRQSWNPDPLRSPYFRWRFRRYLSDGRGVSRFETGMASTFELGWDGPDRNPLQSFASAYLSGSIDLRQATGAWAPRRLVEAGAPLARLLLRSTTRLVDDPRFAANPDWVAAGETMLLVEHLPPHDTMRAGRPGRRIALNGTYPFTLRHARVSTHGRFASVFFVERGRRDVAALRRLRIHLFRLHSERECLKQVLRAIARGQLTVHRGTDASDDLQRYLDDAANRIGKPAYDGVLYADLMRDAYATDALISEGERASLEAGLQDVRGNLRRKLSKVTSEEYYL